MLQRFLLFLLSLALSGSLAAEVVIEVGPARVVEGVTLEGWQAEQTARADALRRAIETLPGTAAIHIGLSPARRAELSEANRLASAGQPFAVGLVEPVGLEVDFTALRPGLVSERLSALSGGWLRRTASAGLTWVIRLDAENTGGIRLHLTDIHLPPGAALYLHNGQGDVRGPYRGDEGSVWTHSIGGEEFYLQLVHPWYDDAALAQTRFRVHEMLLLEPSLTAFCASNAPCIVDASCYDSSDWPFIESARRAVANILFMRQGVGYVCSGGLLNDIEGTGVPYFLTANHCLNTQAIANTVETRFDFRTAECGGPCFWPNTPTTTGTTLLSTSSNSDHTLLRLNQNPPAGAVRLGWTTDPVASLNGVPLYRLSHPRQSPQAFSAHSTDAGASTCTDYPRGRYIYSRDTIGATEGGSSGSPVMTTSGLVVGHLTGACGTNLGNVCDSVNNATMDGAFASYYSNVAPWLNPSVDPGDPGACPSSAVLAGQPDEAQWRTDLYAVRDEILPRLPGGAWMRERYYRYGHEVTGLILGDPDLHAQAIELLRQGRPALEQTRRGELLRLPPGFVTSLVRFVRDLQAVASPSLAQDLNALLPRLGGILLQERLGLNTVERRPVSVPGIGDWTGSWLSRWAGLAASSASSWRD